MTHRAIVPYKAILKAFPQLKRFASETSWSLKNEGSDAVGVSCLNNPEYIFFKEISSVLQYIEKVDSHIL